MFDILDTFKYINFAQTCYSYNSTYIILKLQSLPFKIFKN